MLKLNVDGAFRDSDKNGGWGYVIRDESGEVIQSKGAVCNQSDTNGAYCKH